MTQFNRFMIACAGSGKTTHIIEDIQKHLSQKILVLTYTNENYNTIREKLIKKFGYIPDSVKVYTWFTFLLNECARPYQNPLYNRRITNIQFVQQQSTRYVSKDSMEYYFTKGDRIYSDKISDFICRRNEETGGMVINRLERSFQRIYIDEVQDLAGYDLDLLRLLLESAIIMTAVGDHRQCIYQTHPSLKNKQFRKEKIIEQIRQWESEGLCVLEEKNESHRSNQMICDFANLLYPEMSPSVGLNTKITGHDGVFYVHSDHVPEYIREYKVQPLKYNARTTVEALNFGVSKGKTYDRVLIYPNGRISEFLKSGDTIHLRGSLSRYYVAFTRAKHSIAFVFDKEVNVPGVTRWIPPSLR